MTKTIGIVIRPFNDEAVICLTNIETWNFYYDDINDIFVQKYSYGDFVAYATRQNSNSDFNIEYHIICTNEKCFDFYDVTNFNHLVKDLCSLIDILSFRYNTPLCVGDTFDVVSIMLTDVIIRHKLTYFYEKKMYLISSGRALMPWECSK